MAQKLVLKWLENWSNLMQSQLNYHSISTSRGAIGHLAKILETAGPVSNSAAGVISLLTELILDLKDDMMFSDVATWQPESIISDAERQARRDSLLED